MIKLISLISVPKKILVKHIEMQIASFVMARLPNKSVKTSGP